MDRGINVDAFFLQEIPSHVSCPDRLMNCLPSVLVLEIQELLLR
jgi:hypothetical protein